MVGNRVYEREFNPAGFALAALCAPAFSVIIVLVCALVAAALDGSTRGGAGLAATLGMGLLMTLICTLWGVIPALAFGALVMAPFERLRRGRNPPQWAYGLAGLGAAALYVIVSLGLAQVMGGGVMRFAPWAAPLNGETPIRGASLLGGAIVLAGVGAGLIYERFSRVVYRSGAWRPSDGVR